MPPKLERRQFGRRVSSTRGWIVVKGRPKLGCHIANISPKGALLELTAPPWLPFLFELVLEDSGTPIACEFRHKTDNGIGVHFCKLDADHLEKSKLSLLPSDMWTGRKVTANTSGKTDSPERPKR